MSKIKKETFTVDATTIILTATSDFNTFDAITTTIQPADIENDTFTTAVWTAIKKQIKALHIKNYKTKTYDEAVVNAVYDVKYGGEERAVIIPLMDLLEKDDRAIYNNKANMLQTATALFLNTEYTTTQQRTKARTKTEDSYKTILQWAFDFLISNRKDGVKVYVNIKDVDIISGMLLKLRKDKITTTGERTIQAYIEYAYRQKVAGRPFFVELYSVQKEQNGTKNLIDTNTNNDDTVPTETTTDTVKDTAPTETSPESTVE